jgi:exosortase/archaeosortase family protein
VISIATNVIRNAFLTFFHGTGNDSAFYWLHDSWGGDLYSTCMLGLIFLLLQGIDRWIVPVEPDESEAEPEL